MNYNFEDPEKYVISKEVMKQVWTYLPIEIKDTLAWYIANACTREVEVDTGIIKVPPMYEEDLNKKSRYLMSALASFYIHANKMGNWEDNGYLMTEEEYDRYGCGHILNQIERFKADPELKDICFDLLQDYKDLEKRVNSYIHEKLTVLNDPVGRIAATLGAYATPDMMQKALGELEKLQKEMEEYKETRNLGSE